MISTEDYLQFVDDALDGMIDIVADLGDELANSRPDFPAANSPYAILMHCLGVMEYWAGQVVRGRPVQRDRSAEFRAKGPVADLIRQVRVQRARFAEDLRDADPFASPRGEIRDADAQLPLGRSQGGALLHVYEELARHRGQMEISRDILRC